MDELLERLLSLMSDDYDKSEGYIVYDFLKAVAIVANEYNVTFESLVNLFDVDKMTGSFLEMYVKQRKGIERNQATKAVGVLTVTGTGTVTVGDLFETVDAIQFFATETVQIVGSGNVAIAAIVSGVTGNVQANKIIQMPVTISGITSVTNPAATIDGFDIETEDSLRDRYYLAVRTPATSGNVNHYKQWATSISGVGGVKVFPRERGNNTVEVVIIDSNKKPPSTTLINNVQEYIDPNSTGLGYGEAPIGAFCYVVGATALTINVSVTIVREIGYTAEQVLSTVTQALSRYLNSIAFEVDYVSYAAIGYAIFECEGVADYSNLKINNTTSNILVANKQTAVLGGVTIA